jgi:hypothetical protein
MFVHHHIDLTMFRGTALLPQGTGREGVPLFHCIRLESPWGKGGRAEISDDEIVLISDCLAQSVLQRKYDPSKATKEKRVWNRTS